MRIVGWKATAWRSGWYGTPEPMSWAPVFATPRPQTVQMTAVGVARPARRFRLCSSSVPLMPYA